MKLSFSFHIDYRTNWGESLYIVGSLPALGADEEDQALLMKPLDQQQWTLDIDVNTRSLADITYHYLVRNEHGDVKREYGVPHRLIPSRAVRRYEIYDRWREQPWDKPYYSQAFTDAICSRPAGRDTSLSMAPDTLCIAVEAPMVTGTQQVAISGASEALGAWNPKKAVRLNDHDFPVWRAQLPLSHMRERTEYKFVILRRGSDEVVAWEDGENRVLEPSDVADAADTSAISVLIRGLRLRRGDMAPWRGAGTAIPVFSLRTADDMGVGDFVDLLKMIDWVADTGQSVLQTLPVNDTTKTCDWTDSYPYDAVSSFALHPLYLRPQAMGTLHDPARRDYYAAKTRALNALADIDYKAVMEVKNEYFHEIFAQDGADTIATDEYRAFEEENRRWLDPYAAFCVMRQLMGTAQYQMWGKYAAYSPRLLRQILTENAQKADYYRYLQYHLDRQLVQAREYAHRRGVALKGDIPIGISRTSVDAWVSPGLYNMQCQAGAPPDDFSVLGQTWGFPTYNWTVMRQQGYSWWQQRLRHMARYFDAFRIDHVLGFFRIWQVPMTALHGLLGSFSPALPFTPQELKERYDFHLDKDLHTRPYIMDRFMHDFFGDFTPEVIETYFTSLGYGRYSLKEPYDTQRKVAAYFASQPISDKNSRICNALLGLIDDVLFIEDPTHPGTYHPRISAQHTYIYHSLTDYERWAFDRLYNDFYYHRNNDLWAQTALERLPAIVDATAMLPCAEDLGMIPSCVPDVLSRLQVLTLEVERMPKEYGRPFADMSAYPWESVCTTSTHDMEGIRQWWEHDRERTQRYWQEVLHMTGAAPYSADPWVCDKIIEAHLRAPSMLCILPWQDWMSTHGESRRQEAAEERVNDPADGAHRWRYRMHLDLAALLMDTAFSSSLRSMIQSAGR